MTQPCRHCGDADVLASGLCVPCDRDDALSAPVEFPLLGLRHPVVQRRGCRLEQVSRDLARHPRAMRLTMANVDAILASGRFR